MLNTVSMKRISKELSRDFNDYEYSFTVYHPNKRYMEIKLIIDDKCLRFKIFPDYPFKPPYLFINDVNYIDRHKIMHVSYKDLLNSYSDTYSECPCCDTVLCNWSPGNMLIDVLQEYFIRENKYNKIKTRLVLNILQSQLPFDDFIISQLINFI
tara:strand:- start:2573 stop:3034 length:462 start_codon:yes stop_codon:yes gene_type:complete